MIIEFNVIYDIYFLQKFRQPTSEYLDPPNLWKPYNTENNPYFQFGDENDNMKPSVKLSSNFLKKRMDFWRENFPL